MRLLTIILTIAAAIHSTALDAQELEYKMEIGGALGGSSYQGDINGNLIKEMNPAFGLMARKVLNPHMAIKGNLIVAGLSGSTDGHKGFIPSVDETGNTTIAAESAQTSFKRTLVDLGAQFEYNLWGYGTGKGFKNTKRLTPYIAGGLGLTVSPKTDAGVFTINIPVGAGVKYKLADRLNIGAELTYRYTLSDKLDTTGKNGTQLDDPYRIKSSAFKNKDSYSVIMVFMTYDMFPKYRKCNN